MDEIGEVALEDAVGEAVDTVLGRVPARERAAALRSLRIEMEQCLLGAPFNGSTVDALHVRARLATVLATYDLEPALPEPGTPP